MRILFIISAAFLMVMPSEAYALAAMPCAACDASAPYDASRLWARIVDYHLMYRLWIYALAVLLVMARYWYRKSIRKDKDTQARDYLFFAALLPLLIMLTGELLSKTVGTSASGWPCPKFCTPLPAFAGLAEDLLLWAIFCLTGRFLFNHIKRLPSHYRKIVSAVVAVILAAVITATII